MAGHQLASQPRWRVRTEDDPGNGREIALERLSHGIEDGVWGEADMAWGPHDAGWTIIGEHPVLEEFLPPTPLLRDRDTEEAEMDMTPMIDVTFQLLIFFMIAATYIVQKTMLLPRFQPDEGPPTATLSELARENIVVKVARDRSVTVDGGAAPLGDLTSALVAAAQRRQHASAELILDVDDEVDQQTVVTVLDAAAGADIEQVHFVSRAGGSGSAPAPVSAAPASDDADFQPPGLSPGK
jgi:biopolymer transport protein ExbD